jgi:hypothetical protein
MRLNVLKRVVGTARACLFAGAVALLLASWGGVARADGDEGGGNNTPEISLGALGGAMTLLAGGLLLVRESLRSRPAAQ